MSELLPIFLGNFPREPKNNNDNVNPHNFSKNVQRNYRVRLANVPNNDLTLQNFQDATLGKKLAKTIDHTFKWRKPMENDLLNIDNEIFPSFANYVSQKRGVTGNK